MKQFTFVCAVLLAISGALAFFVLNHPRLPCANSISCINDLSAVVENDALGIFLNQPVTVPAIDIAADSPVVAVLGEQSISGEKHIYVDLDTQTLYAFAGDDLFFETLVSTGKWGRTPPGEYRIWTKIRSTRMSGGSGNDYYNLPNVPYVMFFYSSEVSKGRGYSLHGAYWHNNFGHEMSHGCVNMRPIDAKKIYDWANPVTNGATTNESADDPGTPITICTRIEFSEGATPLCIE